MKGLIQSSATTVWKAIRPLRTHRRRDGWRFGGSDPNSEGRSVESCAGPIRIAYNEKRRRRRHLKGRLAQLGERGVRNAESRVRAPYRPLLISSVPQFSKHDSRGIASGRAHHPASRMRGRAAEIEVRYRRPILGPTRQGSIEEELFEREFSLKDISFRQAQRSVRCREASEPAIPRSAPSDSARIRIACRSRFVRILPFARPSFRFRWRRARIAQTRHDVLSGRGQGVVRQRCNHDVHVRPPGELSVLGIIVSPLHIVHAGGYRDRPGQMRPSFGKARESRQAVQGQIHLSRRASKTVTFESRHEVGRQVRFADDMPERPARVKARRHG